jgi:hypothetical protein
MKWHHPGSGTLPNHQENVLINAGGEYFFAVFDSEKQIFKVEDELKETFFSIDEPELLWSRTVPKIRPRSRRKDLVDEEE